jgi:hypothetical protein
MFMSDSALTLWAPRVLSVLRIVVALLYLQHGLTRFFGFPGPAPASMPFFPIILAGLIETIGSILLLIACSHVRLLSLCRARWQSPIGMLTSPAIRSPITTAVHWLFCIASCSYTSYSPVPALGAWMLRELRNPIRRSPDSGQPCSSAGHLMSLGGGGQ